MIALLKAAHIIAFTLWMAGLLLLPVLMQARGRHPEMQTQPGFAAFRWLTHYAYTAVITPAAVVAIVAGTILIFAQDVLVPWMLAKLVVVAGLVLLHAWFGNLIVKVGEERGSYRMPPVGLSLLVLFPLIGGVLWLVLAKPDLGALIIALPEFLQTPRDRPIPAKLDPI